MKSNSLDRLYDRFSPEERFKLDVEAYARGDEQESRRLRESCPRRTYTMNQWAFSIRWQVAAQLANGLCLEIARHSSCLRTIDALREVLPYARATYRVETSGAYLSGHEAGSRYVWSRAGMDGDPPGWERPDDGEAGETDFDPAVAGDLVELGARLEGDAVLPGVLDRLERVVVQEAWTAWEAFARFSEGTVGIVPERLLEAISEPGLADVEDLKGRRDKLTFEAYEDQVTECQQALAEVWQRNVQEA